MWQIQGLAWLQSELKATLSYIESLSQKVKKKGGGERGLGV